MKKILTTLIFFLPVLLFGQKFPNLAPTPPMGWNSWNTFNTNINEKLIKDVADAFVKDGYKDAGYKYIIIDDCWSMKQRGTDGNLVPDPAKFPGGMKALADYVHSKGLKMRTDHTLRCGACLHLLLLWEMISVKQIPQQWQF
jgi:alpha-galactosidase